MDRQEEDDKMELMKKIILEILYKEGPMDRQKLEDMANRKFQEIQSLK